MSRVLRIAALLISAACAAPAGEAEGSPPTRPPTFWRADPGWSAKERTAGAAERRGAEVDRMLAAAGIEDRPRRLLLIAYKKERVLEAWAAAAPRGPMQHVASFHFCAASGRLGPKRRQGDRQVPEGFYRISGFNPKSAFHLSLRVGYPNRSDRILGERGNLGGDIMIHGDCVSIGCIALGDERIEELWVLARRVEGPVEVHIYPARDIEALIASGERPEHHDFWRDLARGLAEFERTRIPPRAAVDRDSRYRLSGD